jgi:hypothetical protein
MTKRRKVEKKTAPDYHDGSSGAFVASGPDKRGNSMCVRIFLFSDLHLGMQFSSYPAEIAGELAEARFRTLERLVKEASRLGADLLAVAGDLFDRLGVPKSDIRRAASIIAGFEGKCAAVLPGNHDYVSGDREFWKTFEEAAGGRVLVCAEARSYPLESYGIPAEIFAAPCDSKHSRSNRIGWIRDAAKRDILRIGLAHGAVEGLSPDTEGNYFPMSRDDLSEAGMDLWMIGHAHVPFPEGSEANGSLFSAGTPEPDGFDCPHPGHAWLLECAGDTARGDLLTVGEYRFLRTEQEIRDPADIGGLERLIEGSDPLKTLLQVSFRGVLEREERTALLAEGDALAKRLFHLAKFDVSGVTERITRSAIDAAYPEGSFPWKLLAELERNGDALALQNAWDLLSEVRDAR